MADQLQLAPHESGVADVVALLAHQAGQWPVLIGLVALTAPRLAPYLIQAWILSSDRRTDRYVRIQQAREPQSEQDPFGTDCTIEQAKPVGPARRGRHSRQR